MALPPIPPGRRRKKTDLTHLKSLPSDEPLTSIGWVKWIWPEIHAGLASGKKLKEIWAAAQRDGLTISYPQFRVYVSRLRHRERRQNVRAPAPQAEPITAEEPPAAAAANAERPIDPLYNIRVQLEKKRNFYFEYNPFPDPNDDIK